MQRQATTVNKSTVLFVLCCCGAVVLAVPGVTTMLRAWRGRMGVGVYFTTDGEGGGVGGGAGGIGGLASVVPSVGGL